MKGVKGEEKAEEHKTVIEDKRKGHEPRTVGKQANNKSSESIDDNEYKDDFQHNQINDDDSDIEPLYNREEEEKPKSKGKTESSKKDKKKGKGYKPDKKKLAEIK